MAFSETARTVETMVRIPFSIAIVSTKDRLVYHSTEGGTLTLWSVDPATGSKFRITPGPVEQFADPRHDSNLVYYAKDVAKGSELHKIYAADAIHGKETLAVDPPPMRIEGLASTGRLVAFTGSTKDEMALYTAESSSPEKRQTLPPLATLTDAGKKHLVGWGSLANNPRSSELFIFDHSTSEYTEYTPKEGSSNKTPKLWNGRVLFESDYTGKNRLHVYDMGSHELTEAPSTFDDHLSYNAREYPNYGWTDDGRTWFIGKKDGEAKAFLDGKETPTPPGILYGMALFKGKAYVIQSSIVQPSRVVEADPKSNIFKTLVDNTPPADIIQRLGKGRLVHFKSFDDRIITGLVVDHGSPRRTVVLVHGGPWSEYPNTWGPIICSVAVSGYNVIAPNFRGSTGYGEEFRKLDIGDPGGGDLQDIIATAQWAKKNNLATEVAIMGYSYGGYMTLFALGKEPEVFSCGVAGAPVADWKEMHEVSDALYRDFIEQLFDKKLELLSDRSPITYAKNVRRPVCIIAAQNDSRTPIKPVLRYAMELARESKPFELHSIPETGHSSGSNQELVDIILPAVNFLQRQFPPETSTANPEQLGQ